MAAAASLNATPHSLRWPATRGSVSRDLFVFRSLAPTDMPMPRGRRSRSLNLRFSVYGACRAVLCHDRPFWTSGRCCIGARHMSLHIFVLLAAASTLITQYGVLGTFFYTANHSLD